MARRPPAVRVTQERTLVVARMLIAAYFIANATGLAISPGGIAFVPSSEPATVSAWASTTVVWLTGVAILVGRSVRPAALILALHTIYSALVAHGGLLGGTVRPDMLVTEIALVGALALIALTASRDAAAARHRPDMPTARLNDPLRGAPQFRPALDLAAFQATLAEIEASERSAPSQPSALHRSA